MGTNEKKINGLLCGRKNGNSDIFLKKACIGAEEFGVESEIIRAAELKIKPCRGCVCSNIPSKGQRVLRDNL
jgi:multimeric flavodoxin WrbA